MSYGSAELVERNLSVLADGRPDLDVLVVDCFSSADERDRVAAVCARRGWTPVLLEDNLGFGGGVNRGAALALDRGAHVLLVVNPDAVLTADAAHTLVAAVESDPQLLAAPEVRRPDGSLWTAGVDLHLDDGTMAGIRHRDRHEGRPRMFWVSGACFAISADLWTRLGGFADAYFLYWEDVDLSRRVHDLGGRVAVVEAVAVHDEGGTHEDRTGGRAKSETYYYYNIRNRLLFARLRMTATDAARWRRSALRVSWGILMQGGRRQLIESRAPWRALFRGLRDARRGVTGPAPR